MSESTINRPTTTAVAQTAGVGRLARHRAMSVMPPVSTATHQHQRHYHTHGSFYGHECFVEWPHHQFATQQEAVVRHIQHQPGFRQQQECIQDCGSDHGCPFGEQSYQKVKDTYGQGFPRGHNQVIHQCMDPYTGLERALTQHKELDHLEDYQPQQVYTHNGQIACQRLFETPGCRGGLLRGK